MAARKFIDDVPSVLHYIYRRNGLTMTEILKYYEANYDGLLTNFQLRTAIGRALGNGMKNGSIVQQNRRFFIADDVDGPSTTLQSVGRRGATQMKSGCKRRRRRSCGRRLRRCSRKPRCRKKRPRRCGCPRRRVSKCKRRTRAHSALSTRRRKDSEINQSSEQCKWSNNLAEDVDDNSEQAAY